MAQNLWAFSVIAILFISVGVSAKRGCSAFGHSCFGGHGKRSGDSPGNPSSSELMGRRPLRQEEMPSPPVYPNSGYAMPPYVDDIIPIRDGGVYDQEDNSARDFIKMKLPTIIKHLLNNARRSQQNADGYYIDSL